mmetsp:Transcript_21186/g.36425  ORF Transcript_21186/g.36425 Transcript_21186/m.36425 type:complete len:164 (+) Transcript_21186:56-547(+)|eukprot:CAMPEP_0183737766 /NCGR_PEP_ID=MMETSP0737-20130205/52855_1 /TAXON_ID=385413 /ORGANISM="Thalassiosira miniscula, Strain CCMP1093" /LENGTH=163 /DNA_ID=CAMNT_0025972131 /DNA_START=104 /DNA_END=595 /DNA_ORIENTATION=-
MIQTSTFCLAIVATALSKGSAFAPSSAAHTCSRAPSSATPQPPLLMQRREIFEEVVSKITVGAAAATAGVIIGSTKSQEACALDMDSFEKSLIEKDTTQCNPKLDSKCIPKLTADEALCKYGVPGADARTAACRRVRDAGGLLPTSKGGERNTAGWVNNPIAL